MSSEPQHSESDETAPAECADPAHVAWLTARVERARADYEAGRTVPWEAVKAWIDSWDTPDELPRPRA